MKLNITGQKFNMLTAIKYVKTTIDHKTVWQFKCDCGNIVEKIATNVKDGGIKSCGCLVAINLAKIRKEHGPCNILPKGQASFNNLYHNYKKSAKHNKRSFELTPDQFRQFTSSKCYFCGKLPYNEHKPPSNNGGYLYNGIDRLNNNLGYTIENCVPCCTLCNYTKRDLTINEFKELISNIYINFCTSENTKMKKLEMNKNKLLNFGDVLIEPVFSEVKSRKDVDVSIEFLGLKSLLPIVNSNMDTISNASLCKSLANYKCLSSLHRFWSIEENVKAFNNSLGNGMKPLVSIGITEGEFERAKALYDAGAEIFILDVAHAANIAVVEVYNKLVKNFPNVKYIVGDFGTGKEIQEFLNRVIRKPDAVKCGIGIGSQCITSTVTGVGNTALSCLIDCTNWLRGYDENIKLVLDGGVSTTGDIAKALIAGADLIMSGSMFAGCDEAAGKVCSLDGHKEYRGSASLPSYKVQGKEAPWRAPEGISTIVASKGPVVGILNNISGGLRSACSYVGAFNLNELKANGKFQYKKTSVNA